MKEPEAHVNSPLQLRAEMDAQFAEEMWRFRHPEEGGEKLTLEAILVEVPLRYGITVGSLDTLSRFYKWLGLRRRFQQKNDAIRQLQEEMRKDSKFSEDAIKKVGRRLFLTESVMDKDRKLFVDMVKIGQNDVKLDQNDQKIAISKEVVELDKRKLTILEKKAAFYDAVKEKAKEGGAGGVTAEQMEDIERRLKMM
jgi:hypothetical protein